MNNFSSALTKSQREVFDSVKAFVMENRNAPSASHYRAARLALPNQFPARDRTFITKLSQDLHLSVQWDEYDEQDVNLVTWRFPRTLDDGEENEVVEDGGENSEWEDADEDEESRAAVDRVLKKYEKAPVADPDAEGDFDARHEHSIKEKMDEWKRGYYHVCLSSFLAVDFVDDIRIRANWKYHTTTLRRWVTSPIDTWRVYSG